MSKVTITIFLGKWSSGLSCAAEASRDGTAWDSVCTVVGVDV